MLNQSTCQCSSKGRAHSDLTTRLYEDPNIVKKFRKPRKVPDDCFIGELSKYLCM
jgi:hypothetical protein